MYVRRAQYRDNLHYAHMHVLSAVHWVIVFRSVLCT
jgi:hypothetical protein